MSGAMRIGFVYDALYPFVSGGAERRYHELARRLSAQHEVHHVTWQWWDGPAETTIDGITLHGVGRPPPLYGSDGKRTVREAARFAARIVPVLLRQRWDVIDCSATPYLPLYAAWAASRVTRTPLVATWHEFWGAHWLEYLPERPMVARLARALEAGARPLADRIAAVSPFTLRRMGAAPDAAHVIVPNGVDLAAYADVPGSPRGRRWDVAYVGRLIDEKRVDLLLDALAALRRRMPEVRCAIVGEGPARHDLELRAGELGLGGNVRFLGHIPQAATIDVLRDAHLFVMPSSREGFAITVVEAMACGAVPVVVRGAHTAAADLIQDGIDGRVCDPTPDTLAVTLDELLSASHLLPPMRVAARQAAQRYDWDALALEMEQAYRRCLEPARMLASAT